VSAINIPYASGQYFFNNQVELIVVHGYKTSILINHGYEPQSKLWKQFPQQAAGYYTLRFAGLFSLPIPLRCAFGIGVSQ
jgi:hypothetical protein